MGRMWDVLRRDSSVPRENAATHAKPLEDAGPMLAGPEETPLEEVPFIEVGPRKSIEASPSVLAYEKKKDQGRSKPQDIPLPSSEAPTPRILPFRAVFLVAPETEAETQQTDAVIHLFPTQEASVAGCIVAADR
jgi:hypothetical protein